MNPTLPTLYNPKTGITAIPNANTTAAQQATAQVQGFISTIPQGTSPAISTANIGIQPYAIPPTPPVTSTTGSLAVGTNATVANMAQDAAYIPPETNDQKSLKTSLSDLFKTTNQNNADIAALNQDAELVAKKARATAASAQIDQIDKSYQDEVNRIKSTNEGGQLTSGVQIQLQNAQDRYQNNRANAALAFQIESNDYKGAQDTINQKVKALQDQNSQLTENYKLQASLVNNDLTDSQKVQMAANVTQKPNEAKSVEDAYRTLLTNTSQNKAPPSVLTSLDSITADYKSGKITADQAQSKMYQAAGHYAVDQTKAAQLSNLLLSSSKIKAETDKLNSQINSSGDTVAGLAGQLVGGTLAPAELSKRATGSAGSGAYNDVLTAANKLSMQTTGKPFDIAKADRDYKFANNPQTLNTLKYLGSLTGGVGQTGNLDELVNLSNAIDRTEFPALNKLENWTKLETGDPTIASYHAVVTEVADQVAKILQGGGTGSGTSDAKLNQALGLFQSSFTKGQIVSTVNSLKPLLNNRAKFLIGNNPYLSDFAEQFGVGNNSDNSNSNSYSSERSQLKSGEILIERNGQVGAIPAAEFNSKTDKKL